jgi:hypothetical protein
LVRVRSLIDRLDVGHETLRHAFPPECLGQLWVTPQS